MADEPEYLNVQQAADRLGTNRRRIWQLIKEGQFHAVSNPLDKREKLIPKSQVEALSKFSKKDVA
jgi:Helix-turn-helix domain